MTNYNKVFLIGRLTKEPESKVTMSGVNLSRFTIAVNRIKKAGEESEADFINVVVWRRLASLVRLVRLVECPLVWLVGWFGLWNEQRELK